MEFLKEYLDYIVFAILFFMSFLVVAFSIERLIFYSNVKVSNYKDEKSLEIALSKNLTTLYIVYQNAPYIGLLGTVIGIMITFYDMANANGMDVKSIMLGLSLALKATAAGLCVAIPTLMIYNAFNRKVEVKLSEYKGQDESK